MTWPVSLAEGVATHRAELTRRLETTVVVQFDEPLLPAALAGRLTGVTSFSPVHPVDEAVATALLDECVATVGGEVVLHSCAPDLPWKALQRSTLHAISVDVSTLTAADLDGIGEFVESGRTVVLGVVPSTPPVAQPSVREVAKAAAAVTDRLGFSRSVLHRPHRHHARVWAGRRHARMGAGGDRARAEGGRRVRRGPRRDIGEARQCAIKMRNQMVALECIGR